MSRQLGGQPCVLLPPSSAGQESFALVEMQYLRLRSKPLSNGLVSCVRSLHAREETPVLFVSVDGKVPNRSSFHSPSPTHFFSPCPTSESRVRFGVSSCAQ